jgi:hypothetical protein
LLFDKPVRRQTEKDLWRLTLIEAAPHPAHHVAFVDAQQAHVPMYPAELSLTLALWSSSARTSAVDWVKRIPVIQENASSLRSLANRLGLRKQLDLNVIEYFDFYPSDDGFVGMRERQEFPLGPNENYLKSLFHTIQATGNSRLAPLLRRCLQFASARTREVGNRLVDDLEHDRPIEAVLSPGHYNLPHANFTRAMIDRALRMQ